MIVSQILKLYAGWGMDADVAPLWSTLTSVGLSLLLSWVVYELLTRVVIPIVLKFVAYTSVKWDDILFNPRLLKVVAELVFVIVARLTLPASLIYYPDMAGLASVVCKVGLVCVCVHLVNRFILALYNLLEDNSSSRITTLKGIRQMLQILTVLVGLIIVISILARRDPLAIITGLGAAATVLMLVFKDSIMGVVAGVQLTLNDMLRPGDWITLPSRHINGNVVEVGLTTVKIRNFDNTIVTVPPYSLISESYQNWRGMRDSGGRRMNRSFTIDVNSVRFCTPRETETFAQEEWGKGLAEGEGHVNLTLYRRYLEHYISGLPDLNTSDDMIYMVRELAPTPQGVPLELYFFTKNTAWKSFEHMQAAVMDHVMASVGRFGLRIYQAPSGLDLIFCGSHALGERRINGAEGGYER